MKIILLSFLLVAFQSAFSEEALRTFSNADGKTLEDRLVKYNYKEKLVTFDRSGRVPLNTFSKEDQAYILQWNMCKGFESTMRFKAKIERKKWSRMKSEQTFAPYWMESFQMPEKETPSHIILILEDYEETTSLYLESEGYSITLRNQNVFPIEDITVESKVFYEQEYYLVPDDILAAYASSYTETVISNKVKVVSEIIPRIVPQEEVIVHSSAIVLVDQQTSRESLVSESEGGNGEDDDMGDENETDEAVSEVLGDFDIEDHNRRRKGKTRGVWIRVSIPGPDGERIFRDFTMPDTLSEKVTWNPIVEEEIDEDG